VLGCQALAAPGAP